jgi:4-amino-4-deoxy-L-arabinose transferase-like glycosyltransferase
MGHEPRLAGEGSPATRVVPVAAGLLLGILAFVPLANMVAGRRAAPWYPHVVFYWIVMGGALLLALLALARWMPRPLERLQSAATAAALRVPARLFIGAAAAFAFVASVALAVIAFARQPQDADEVAHLFHAKILASGRLALPPDANPEFFAMDDMIDWGRWYSHFPVGGPAVLVPGVMSGFAWVVNPLLTALAVIGVYTFARRAYGEAVARTAAVLFALAPFVLFMGASYMNHTATIVLVTVALTQLAIWVSAERQRELDRSAALLGLTLGLAFIIRPVDALALAAVIGVMQLVELRRDGGRIRSLLFQIAAGMIPVLVLFYVNARTTGAPLRLGYEVLYGTAHQLGFHDDPYGVPFTPARALGLLSKYLLQLNAVLFEWPLPALGLLAAGLLVLRRPSRWDYLLIGSFAAQAIAYSLYWGDGMFRGPRYLFTALVAVVILVARAPFLLTEATRGTLRRAIPFVVPACVLMAWLVATGGAGVATRVRSYQRIPARFRVDPTAVTRAAGVHHALVFVNEDSRTRTLHRLWSLGIGRGDAARLMDSAPVCAVRLAIDAEQSRSPAQAAGRLERLVNAATTLDTLAPVPAACRDDQRRDAEGWLTYLPFFAANEVGPDGRLGGDVVYALDLGEHNEVLRSRFGDRAWYRIGARSVSKDTLPIPIPYDVPAR